jgi:hypothetical protein
MRRIAVLVLAALLVATALPGLAARSAHANGVPQLVKLTYVEGISNWGPENAEGVLEFSFAEAYAKVDVKNLVPQEGYTYDGWLTAPDGASLFVGEIPVDATGIGQFDGSLANLDRYDYTMFVIAARPAGGLLPTEVPAERSIAGRFTVLDDNGGTAGGEGDIRPTTLPETGEKAPSFFEANAGRVLYVIAVMAVSAGAAVTIRRIQRGRSA